MNNRILEMGKINHSLAWLWTFLQSQHVGVRKLRQNRKEVSKGKLYLVNGPVGKMLSVLVTIWLCIPCLAMSRDIDKASWASYFDWLMTSSSYIRKSGAPESVINKFRKITEIGDMPNTFMIADYSTTDHLATHLVLHMNALYRHKTPAVENYIYFLWHPTSALLPHNLQMPHEELDRQNIEFCKYWLEALWRNYSNMTCSLQYGPRLAGNIDMVFGYLNTNSLIKMLDREQYSVLLETGLYVMNIANHTPGWLERFEYCRKTTSALERVFYNFYSETPMEDNWVYGGENCFTRWFWNVARQRPELTEEAIGFILKQIYDEISQDGRLIMKLSREGGINREKTSTRVIRGRMEKLAELRWKEGDGIIAQTAANPNETERHARSLNKLPRYVEGDEQNMVRRVSEYEKIMKVVNHAYKDRDASEIHAVGNRISNVSLTLAKILIGNFE